MINVNDSPVAVMNMKQDSFQVSQMRYPENLSQGSTSGSEDESLTVWLEFRDSLSTHKQKYNSSTSELAAIELASTIKMKGSSDGVLLYIPPSVSINGQVAWGESEFDSVYGAAATHNNKGIFSPGGAVINAAEEAVRAKITGSAGAKVSMQKQDGRIQEMNKQLLFEGVGFRTFEFQFDFVPKSVNEAKSIQEIIQWFRERMYPNFDNIWLTVPEGISVKFATIGKDMDKLPKIKDCVITSCNLSYGSDGVFGVMEGLDVHPSSTTMSLSLQETQIITSTDTKGGY
jgi:hypothetical protein